MQSLPADRDSALTQQFVKHLADHYGKRQAYAAAVAGAEALLKAPLPKPSRLEALRAVARYRGEHAIKVLTDQAKAGKLPAGAMPKLLADAVAAYALLTKDFPTAPAWAYQAVLAERVRRLASLVPWPARVTAPKAALSWSVQIALPAVKAGTHPAAVKQAVKTVDLIVKDCQRFQRLPARGMALAIHTRLLGAVSAEGPHWPAVLSRQIDLLGAAAVSVFSDNVKAGSAEANAQLNDHQKQMLAAMAGRVGRDAGQAAAMLKKLAAHLARWVRAGHYRVAEAAYQQLAPALPAAAQRAGRLAVAVLWIDEVTRTHRRLLAGGLGVPRKLDAGMVKALQICWVLQDDLTEGDAFLRQVRAVWDGVISHYQRLKYFDIAAEAVAVKDAAAAPAAEAYAQLRAASLLEGAARRELAKALRHYKANEKIALTDAFKKAIAAYEKFITDRPDSLLVGSAAARLEAIAAHFTAHKAHDVAAAVYRDLAAFAAKVKVLAQVPAGGASAAQRWQYTAAGALHAKATEALAKLMAEKKPEAAPPAKISAEFTAAIDACKAFIKANPDSALLHGAVGGVMKAALEYAEVGGWDVAEGIYAGLLADELKIARPERIELARGLCHLGKVIPDHAKKVLTALTSAGIALKLVPARPAWDYDALGSLSYPGEEMKEADRKFRGGATLGLGRPRRPATISRLEGSGGGGGQASAAAARPGPTRGDKKLPPAKPADDLAKSDTQTLAAIRSYQQRRAAQIARLRDRVTYKQPQAQGKQQGQRGARQKQQRAPAVPVLSDAEIARQEKALASAYDIFKAIRAKYAHTPAAEQARGEIMVMVQHWRTIQRWQRAAKLGRQYLADNPTDRELPSLRLVIARDLLAWAAQPGKKTASRQERLSEVADRFTQARAALEGVVKDFRKEKATVHSAQWEIANSFLTQARAVDAFSPTLARGQYVRAAGELQQVAATYHDHPNIAQIPQMLWGIAVELAGRRYHDEAITVWNGLIIHYPTHSLARQAAESIARTYRDSLKRPLLAAETYLEINFARGGADLGVQNLIYQIGLSLKNEKRWVEALHVLEVFVDSFPRHPSAGQALTMVGHIHQTNEAWTDAIAAYRRVINEFPKGTWVRDAKWSIAESTINLSQWREAMAAYRTYLTDYGKDAKAPEAKRRVGILKDLARYQALVDEEGQRKAFDAQYQIAEIVLGKLANPVKAIIEYRKVTARWPKSHLADDALFKVGTTYLSMGETAKARKALLGVAEKYATSPLADDALYLVGKSYEDESLKLAGATRGQTVRLAQKKAQRQAYAMAQARRRTDSVTNEAIISKLRDAGRNQQAEMQEARFAGRQQFFQKANVAVAAQRAGQEVEMLTAVQLADRQDKINAALRRAVESYLKASKVAAADKADEALLRMAGIYADKLKDADAAMKTYLEIVRQFSGTAVAEDASWKIAQYHERQGKYAEAIKAYEAFLRNYRRSPKAGPAQFAIAENYEHLGQWVKAMDAYTNYINNFPKGSLVTKAREQINWIKTYRL